MGLYERVSTQHLQAEGIGGSEVITLLHYYRPSRYPFHLIMNYNISIRSLMMWLRQRRCARHYWTVMARLGRMESYLEDLIVLAPPPFSSMPAKLSSTPKSSCVQQQHKEEESYAIPDMDTLTEQPLTPTEAPPTPTCL